MLVQTEKFKIHNGAPPYTRDVVKMALLRNILFLSLLCGLSTAVVHGPKLDREITREPYIIEMDGPDQPLSDVYKKAQEKEER